MKGGRCESVRQRIRHLVRFGLHSTLLSAGARHEQRCDVACLLGSQGNASLFSVLLHLQKDMTATGRLSDSIVVILVQLMVNHVPIQLMVNHVPNIRNAPGAPSTGSA